MPIPNVSTLHQRIKKGGEGGHEFARIMNLLLAADSREKGYKYTATSDASGDYKGVDGIVTVDNLKIGVQFKFYPTPMSSSQKSSVIKSFARATEQFPEMAQWILVTPEDFDFRMMQWFDSNFEEHNVDCHYWGHNYILDLMLKYPHIGDHYYPELKSYQAPTELSLNNVESFFIQFTHSKELALKLLMNAQPSFSDCQQVFASEYAGHISDVYHAMYRSISDSDEPYRLLEKNRVKIESNTITDIQNYNDNLPGGMRQIFIRNNALNGGVRFYYVHYLKDGDQYGIAQSVWCHINGRWVFFPKPWRIIKSIHGMKSSKDVQRLIRLLRIFGFKKYVGTLNKVDLSILINHVADELRK